MSSLLRGDVRLDVHGVHRPGAHRHTFFPHRDGTSIRDRVDYALPLSSFSAPVHALFVRPMIGSIFAYRREVIARVLG